MNEELVQFQHWMRLREKSPKTVKLYMQLLNKYYNDGQDTVKYLSDTMHLATSTRNVYKSALKALFKFRGEAPDVEPELLTPVRPTNQYRAIIPRDNVNAIILSTRPHWKAKDYRAWRLHVCVELLAYCGIRPTELRAIKLSDVFGDYIWINGIKREEGGKIYPPEHVFKDIERLISLGKYQKQSDLLIPISHSLLDSSIKTSTGYRPKDFRTTFGTEVARVTGDPYMVQALLRHRNIASSMPYVHLATENAKKIQGVKLYE